MPKPEAPFSGTPRFQLLRRLGVGGMGVVYEAFDDERKIRVALKTLRSLEPGLLLRFKQEFRALQGLEHPNLATLFELVNEGGHWFFTMELVDGVDLVSWVRGVDPRQPGYADPLSAPSPISLPLPANSEDDTDLRDAHEPDTERSLSARTPRREAPPFDEARLRRALPQLAAGLARLHRAGKVHRDVKPSNILVTPDGRVVLLDFGLVADWSTEDATESRVVGTVNYMAPEQAAGRRVGPKADWYSVGVILYEVLTGQLPFSGMPLAVMHDKQRQVPLPPSEVALSPCPDDLSTLCAELLSINPDARPGKPRFTSLLGAAAAPPSLVPLSLSSGGVPFVGRARELGLLSAAFEEVRRGRSRVVLVEGPSGVGKSVLVRQFTRALERDVPGVVVLAGRYYEREAMPYRALDAIMDSAAQYLMKLPDDAAEAMLPLDSPLLAHLFPPLRGVGAVSRQLFRPPVLDPLELRARVFAAVRELFIRLSRRRPVVLVIDDVQWSDRDSRAVFAETTRQPDGPALLTIATCRPVEDPVDAEYALAYFQRVGQVDRLPLGPLPLPEARELAQRLLTQESSGAESSGAESPGTAHESTAESIAREAEGHPLFIDALVRHALTVGTHTPGSVRLDDALAVRIDALDERARELLELLTLCAGPLPFQEGLRAMGGDATEMARAVSVLRSAQLLRQSRVREEDAFEPYHDRVRELVRHRLDEATLKGRHAQLARALEAMGRTDPDQLFAQWRGAGNAERAVHYGALAAAKAAEVLAFERAAHLYQTALGYSRDPDEQRRLHARLGEALANAGRGRQAAAEFMAAVAIGDSAAPADTLEWKRRAAEQLLRSGCIDEGLEQGRAVLAAVGLSLPSTPRRALAQLLWNRFRLRLSGLGFTRRSAAEIAAADLTRIDACWSVAGVLGMVDNIRGANFQTLHLRLALGAGEPFRVARALCLEAAFSSTSGGATRKRTAHVLELATALSTEVGDPFSLGWARGMAGVAAAFEGRWQEAFDGCSQGEAILRDKCGGVAWERSTLQLFTVTALVYSGRIAELRLRVDKGLREAEERGDLYGAAVYRLALASMAWLAADDVAQAREKVRDAMAHWSRGGFQVEHFWELLAVGQNDLYAGDDELAYERLTAAWPGLESSLILRVQLTRIETAHLRARVALAFARVKPAGSPERAALLKEARVYARRVHGEKMEWGHPLALLVEAGVAATSGDGEAARKLLPEVVAKFEAVQMPLYAAAARRRLGELLGGDGGQALIAAVDRWMTSAAIVRPERMVAMLAPGF